MSTFHLKDWRDTLERQRAWRRRRPDMAVLVDWLASSALCLSLTFHLPPQAALVALAVLFSLSGFVWLMVAILTAGPPRLGRLTAWDAALFSFAASFAAQTALRLGMFGL